MATDEAQEYMKTNGISDRKRNPLFHLKLQKISDNFCTRQRFILNLKNSICTAMVLYLGGHGDIGDPYN